MLLIINDILDFTKLDAGKVTLEIHPGNLPALLENIKNTYENLAREKGLTLRLEVDEHIACNYEFDETKLSQILGNLITNAIKFTENGLVTIKVEKINSDLLQDQLRFKIIDTGAGIPENNLEEIFDNFSQPKSITTKKHGGSGLGLAIVKKLVELHGSTISVNSTVGKGSTFYF